MEFEFVAIDGRGRDSGRPGCLAPSGSRNSLATLVRCVARGDRAALSGIHQQTVAQIFAIARAMLRSKEDAEEVVCDVYVNLWQRAASYDAARGSVMAWLAVMTRNRAIDRLRQRRSMRSLDAGGNLELLALHGEGPGPEETLTRFQTASAVRQALTALPPQRRELLGLAFFQGLSHQEIAAAVGLPLGTVKSHVRRALASLQAALADPDGADAHAANNRGRAPQKFTLTKKFTTAFQDGLDSSA
jgi:RNA polymerase sigma-70 factor (ECF subfamily)